MNLHTHTNYCDGGSEPIAIIKAAMDLKWEYLGFSSHAPLPFPSSWAMKRNMVNAYSKEIAALKVHFEKDITLYTGWEIDYIQGKGFPAMELKEVVNADYIIASVHYLANPMPKHEIGGYLEIDGDFNQFLKLYQLYTNDLKSLLSAYLIGIEAVLKFRSPCQKIIGHLDKIIINASKMDQFKPLQSWFDSCIIDLFKSHYNGTDLVEINTRPIYYLNRSVPYPGIRILEFLSQQGIACIKSSDAHFANEINLGFIEVDKLLQTIKAPLNFINPHELKILHNNYWSIQKRTIA